MTFTHWIKKISPDVKAGETEYFRNHKGSYYDAMSSVQEKMYVPVWRELMCIIDRFVDENATGKSPCTKDFFLPFVFFS